MKLALLKLRFYGSLASEWIIAQLAFLIFRIIRSLPFESTADKMAAIVCFLSPVLLRNRVAKQNLLLAFPEKSEAERKQILRGMWDNLARSVVEFVHLDKIIGPGRVEIVAHRRFRALRDSGKPAIIVTAHLANWEVLPIGAAKLGLHVTSLFRPPNNRFIADYLLDGRRLGGIELVASRAGAGYELMAVLERGGLVAMLVDQRFRRGALIPFLGRPAKTNTFPAKLARQFDCAVYGTRAIRLPGSRFRVEMTDKIDLPRDSEGHIDIEGATAAITNKVEGWVREYPEQWLWVHRRWDL